MSTRFSQYLKASELISVRFSDTLTSVNAAQLRNASRSSFVTLFGMSIEVSPQSAKAPAPIVEITASSANLAVVMAVHPLNALFSMLVTPFGKWNSCNWERFWNAPDLIVVRSQSPRKLKFLSFGLLWSAFALIVVSLEPSGTLMVSRFLDRE